MEAQLANSLRPLMNVRHTMLFEDGRVVPGLANFLKRAVYLCTMRGVRASGALNMG